MLLVLVCVFYPGSHLTGSLLSVEESAWKWRLWDADEPESLNTPPQPNWETDKHQYGKKGCKGIILIKMQTHLPHFRIVFLQNESGQMINSFLHICLSHQTCEEQDTSIPRACYSDRPHLHFNACFLIFYYARKECVQCQCSVQEINWICISFDIFFLINILNSLLFYFQF